MPANIFQNNMFYFHQISLHSYFITLRKNSGNLNPVLLICDAIIIPNRVRLLIKFCI